MIKYLAGIALIVTLAVGVVAQNQFSNNTDTSKDTVQSENIETVKEVSPIVQTEEAVEVKTVAEEAQIETEKKEIQQQDTPDLPDGSTCEAGVAYNSTTGTCESITTEPVQAVAPAVSNRTYTNPYFEDFKLVYGSDWNFSTKTVEAYDKGLLHREIELTKGNTTILFEFSPGGEVGCGNPGRDLVELRSNINGSGINRYDASNGDGDIYSDYPLNTGCMIPQIFRINTNIPVTDDHSPIIAIDSEYEIEYFLYVSVYGAEHVLEADQIIAQSTLR